MVKVSRIIYKVFAWVFVFGVIFQVFWAGMAVVARTYDWGIHATFGHLWGFPLLFMLITAYLGRLPRGLKWLTWALFGVFILQAEVLIFLRNSVPVLSAFHPVMALVDFALGFHLAKQRISETMPQVEPAV